MKKQSIKHENPRTLFFQKYEPISQQRMCVPRRFLYQVVDLRVGFKGAQMIEKVRVYFGRKSRSKMGFL